MQGSIFLFILPKGKLPVTPPLPWGLLFSPSLVFFLADVGLPVGLPGSLPMLLALMGTMERLFPHQQMLCTKEENMLIEISFG